MCIRDSPNTHAFVTSPEMVMAVALSGNLDFNPITDNLISENGDKVVLDPPFGDELPSNGLIVKTMDILSHQLTDLIFK